jgi:hypothetical protein
VFIGVISFGHKVPIVLETLRLVIRLEAVLHHSAHCDIPTDKVLKRVHEIHKVPFLRFTKDIVQHTQELNTVQPVNYWDGHEPQGAESLEYQIEHNKGYKENARPQ